MELLLVRHGRPHHVREGSTAADPGLDALGHEQAALTATALCAHTYGRVGAVVSSTMRRAVETARPAAEALGLPLSTDERLMELDRGAPRYGDGFAGFSSRAEAWASINRGEWDGYTFDPVAFTTRVVEGVEAVVAAHPVGIVAVFCHGGAISAYLSHVLRTPVPLFCSPDHSGVSRVLAEPDGHRELLSFNERTHLQAGPGDAHPSGGPPYADEQRSDH